MYTKISIQGNIIEITRLSKKNSKATIKKINKDEYIKPLEETGEIYKFNHGNRRTDSIAELRKSFAKLRTIINTNCTVPENLRWITLTYAENMTNSKRLYRDFKKFWMRFKYRWGNAEYIVVPEPQQRGAWHMHLIAIFPKKAPYIENSELRECWRQGFVQVKSVQNVDNMGAYLSAYLTDIEVPMDSETGVVKELSTGEKKKFIKGGRLGMYPANFQIYRCSRGIKRPDEIWIEQESQEHEIIGNAALTFKNEYEWENEYGFRQKVIKEFYNTKRKRTEDEQNNVAGKRIKRVTSSNSEVVSTKPCCESCATKLVNRFGYRTGNTRLLPKQGFAT